VPFGLRYFHYMSNPSQSTDFAVILHFIHFLLQQPQTDNQLPTVSQRYAKYLGSKQQQFVEGDLFWNRQTAEGMSQSELITLNKIQT
jgi:hypothetical protein